MTLPFYTIGHSNRSSEDFVALLQEAHVERVVDVRRIPMSRTNPQFNKTTLPDVLADFQISYEHSAALGGRRGRVKDVPADVNAYWENKSFHNYADYALSREFRDGLERLIEAGRQRRCAIMCSEAVWWRCHRRLIADNLLARSEPVLHIMGRGRLEPARLTGGAVIGLDETVTYPAPMRMD
ncbi:DUF488 domain-containing protein [Brevundimonas diminuta]|uniref:DUF488 domain-containing protein n=1 Tax=Brevundimonas diminuta TaxID=293 RepID=UPI002096A489|nr:DUF488 domain-containing protein [Brevundimonas diminuta]MCO8018662.1 DUF488 domain-containing protein [Brevundimonas diminuta]MCO8020486.1 DUF488 domain-containing protein [Brevundimonas diminuta]